VDRTDLGTHHRGGVFSISFKHLQANPGANGIVVAGRVAAAVEVQADCGSAFLEGQTELGLADDNQGNGAINAGTAPGLDAGKSGCCAHFLPSNNWTRTSEEAYHRMQPSQ
jgi:hypothetical protein